LVTKETVNESQWMMRKTGTLEQYLRIMNLLSKYLMPLFPLKEYFKITISKDPKYIEYTNTFGQYTGEIYLGIYRITENMLVFCVADYLAGRPKVFKTIHGQVMRTFKQDFNISEY